jgi:hypothetical protein
MQGAAKSQPARKRVSCWAAARSTMSSLGWGTSAAVGRGKGEASRAAGETFNYENRDARSDVQIARRVATTSQTRVPTQKPAIVTPRIWGTTKRSSLCGGPMAMMRHSALKPAALGPMSRFHNNDILAERFNTTLRLRCYYRAWACSGAISSLFFLEQKSLRVANFRARCLGHGYEATQSRHSFDAIKDLGLVTWIDPETSRPSWVVVLRLVDGSYRYLSFFTREYSAYDAALTRICEATKIRQVDPTVSSDLDRPFFSLR